MISNLAAAIIFDICVSGYGHCGAPVIIYSLLHPVAALCCANKTRSWLIAATYPSWLSTSVSISLEVMKYRLTWRSFNIKVKPIKLNCLVLADIKGSDTSVSDPSRIVWSKSTPEKVCEIIAVGFVVQIVVSFGSSKGKEELGLGILLALIKCIGKRRTIGPQHIVSGVRGVSFISWAGDFRRVIAGVGGHSHSN